ncbi:MAG: copper-translocating P-type ATPase [Planctomycetes bacterium TMED75]|nr:copper-translocating P-type ATPase [Planctomycetaceae bacterium]OUU90864.1 MAG: copper-translocating P-type ATPase [Planctomycetes bacterium TMED75]
MHCSSCVAHVERALESVAGVDDAMVSLVDSTAQVAGSALVPEQLAQAVRDAGYAATPLAAERSLADERHDLDLRVRSRVNRWKVRTIVGIALWVPLAGIHWFGPGTHGNLALQWVLAAIATISFLYVGWAFFSSAWDALRARTSNMDTLVSIGVISAYVYSLVVLILETLGLHSPSATYFMDAAGLLAFISLGHYLEARTTAQAGGALRALLELQPDHVEQLETPEATAGRKIPTSEVTPGDLILVRPGDRVPVDGEIVNGATALDESSITGEPLPAERTVGDQVLAGTISTTGVITLRADVDGNSTSLSRIVDIVRQAQASKTRTQKFVDTVASVFVPIVLVIAAVTFILWLVFAPNDALQHALVNAVTVLVIACPCALGLATPTAVMAGSGAASHRGILVRSADALERAAVVRGICFDKTGTLTQGRPEVTAADDDVLQYAAGLAAGSNHPLSTAIVSALAARGLEPITADSIEEKPGIGLSGRMEGVEWQLVSVAVALDRGWIKRTDVPEDATCSILMREGNVRGVLTFRDLVREDATRLIERLSSLGLRSNLLTGDRTSIAQIVGQQVGLDSKAVHAQLTPEGKVDFLRGSTEPLAMVGDGINDAAALSEAGARGGVGIAIGSGTNVAIESADIVIPGDQLLRITDTVLISRSTRRTIRQNLILSLSYNTCAIPVAAFGLLGVHGPLVAGIAMGLSSVSVVANSLRLRRSLQRLNPG